MEYRYEKENIFERQHSCKWYFDELIQEYKKIANDDETENLKDDKATLQSTRANLMRDIVTAENSEREPVFLDLLEKKTKAPFKTEEDGVSFFPLFVRKPQKASKESNSKKNLEGDKSKDFFERKKFEICKVLSAIDDIVERLCSKNADESVTDLDKHIVDTATVLKWLFSSEDNTMKLTVQERNRAKEFFRQVYIWMAKQFHNLVKENEGNFTIKTGYEEDEKDYAARANTSNAAFEELDDDSVRTLVLFAKRSLAKTIDEAHLLYNKLDGFRRYAIHSELATDEMKNPDKLESVLTIAYAILHLLLSIFVSYMRVTDLQIPRAGFRSARFVNSNISGGNFANSDFRDVNLSFGIAKNCDFSMSDLSRVKATSADFSGSLFSYVNLTGADFEGVIANDTKFNNVDYGKVAIKFTKDKIEEKQKDARKKAGVNFDEKYKVSISYLNLLKELDDLSRDKGILSNDKGGLSRDKEEFEKLAQLIGKYTLERNNVLANDDLNYLFGDYLNDGASSGISSTLNSIVKYGKSLGLNSVLYDELVDMTKEDGKKAVPKTVILRKASFNSSEMSNGDFNLIDMSLASFRNTDMSDSFFSHTIANSTNFALANFTSSVAYHAVFNYATFEKVLAIGATFIGCDMRSVNFGNANLSNAKIIGDKVQNFNSFCMGKVEENHKAKLPLAQNLHKKGEKVEYNDGNFVYNDSSDSIFTNAIGSNLLLAFRDFSRSIFANVYFRSAIIFDCNFTSSVWNDADLTFALIGGAIFNKSAMKMMSVQEAVVEYSDFSCCSLVGTKLLASDIVNCNFFDSNMSNVNFAHAEVKNTVFRSCLFDSINLSYTKFTDCYFEGIEFETCIGMDKAVFVNCVFDKCSYCGDVIDVTAIGDFQNASFSLGDANFFRTRQKNGVVCFSSVNSDDMLKK